MTKHTLYEAGCSVCTEAANEFINLIPDLDIVRLKKGDAEIVKLENLGVKSVPVLISNTGKIFHLNFGADLNALK